MVPAADVVTSQEALNETFLLSNMCPQVAQGFNRGYWALLENFVRSLTKYFDEVYRENERMKLELRSMYVLLEENKDLKEEID